MAGGHVLIVTNQQLACLAELVDTLLLNIGDMTATIVYNKEKEEEEKRVD